MSRKPQEEEEEGVSVERLLAKAAVLSGREVDESTALTSMQRNKATFGDSGAVDPPYNPESLLQYVELTPHLSPSIAAYATNIEGYGHRAELCESWMADLDSEEARAAIRDALEIERWVEDEEQARAVDKVVPGFPSPRHPAPTCPFCGGELPQPTPDTCPHCGRSLVWGSEGGDENLEVTDEDVDQVVATLRTTIRREQFLFEAFFRNCCSTMSFVKLRRITREDVETHGWGAWELLYDSWDRLTRLNYIPGYTIRPLRDDDELIEVTEPDPVTPLSEDREVKVPRRFRRYVQIVGSRKVYFKEPGDPRVVSRTTGKTYESIEEMRRPKDRGGEGKDAAEANELLYFAQHDPRTPCPPPRWIGNLLSVLGVREADETNYFYLDGNAVPPGILFISGGKVPTQMKDRMKQRLNADFKGAQNRHKILVVEAHPLKLQKGEERTMLPNLHYESLRGHQEDATFQGYDERSADRIGASFRLPPMLRGYTPKDLNRATALAALSFAEQQVFEPERQDVDWIINKVILPRIGVRFLQFTSNSPPTRSAEEIGNLIKVAAPQGGLVPSEIRELLSSALNRSLARIDEEWASRPMAMTLAGLGGEPESGQGEIEEQMEALRSRLEAVLSEELRQAGVDTDLSARWAEPDEVFGEGDDG